MSNKHIVAFSYKDFFRDEYSAGDAGVNEMIEDTKNLVRYVFDDAPEMGERVIDNIYIIAEGDAKNQLRLLNGCINISSPIVFEEEQERIMSHDELMDSYPIRNMAMNIIDMVLDMSAKRIRGMQTTIYKLTKALAISTKVKSDEQSNT